MDEFDRKVLLYKSLKEKVLRKAIVDSAFFGEYVFGYKNSPFHLEWHKFMQETAPGSGGLILAFRGSGKSEQVTICNSLHTIGKDPHRQRIKIVTETDELAENILSRISNTILKNERFQEVFPEIKPDERNWNKHAITVLRDIDHKDPSIVASSITAASTGGRATLIHFDDVCGMRNTLLYPALRKQVKESFESNWLPILDPKVGRWFMVATPWHIEDLVSQLRANKGIRRATEVWAGNDFESPWPEQFSKEFFKQKLVEQKIRGYNRAYRGVALSDEETWLNPMAIKNCIDRDLKLYDVISNPDKVCFTGIDLGHRDGGEASPSVIFTVARMQNGKRIPLDIKINRTANPMDISRAIIDTYNQFNPRLIMVENNGAQKYLVEVLAALGPKSIPVEGQFTGTQKLDPNIGVPSLLAEIETGQWVVPLGAGGDHQEEVCACPTCYWMNEVKNYPLARMDTVMASWLAVSALKKVMERANAGGNFSVWSWT
jgi:hypothetical protein